MLLRVLCVDCGRQTSLAEPGPHAKTVHTVCERCRVASRRMLAEARRLVRRELGR